MGVIYEIYGNRVFIAFFDMKIPDEETMISNGYSYSNELINGIIKRMINENASERPTSQQIYNTFIKYYVEKYKRKISIRKSCSLKKLGNEVIIHLKRFEFDFITFTNKKLNDYLKFPKTINFKKMDKSIFKTK